MTRPLAPRPRPRRRGRCSAQAKNEVDLSARVLALPHIPRGKVEPQMSPHSPHALEGAGLDELRREWQRLYRSEAPRISRDVLVRGIGYRLQELQHGGLGRATRRKLKTLAKIFRTEGRVAPDPGLSLKPGARLVREWHGRTHTVTVTEDGFKYAGASYSSLTKVAKKITGAHWSGPRFFGLVRSSAQSANRDDNG
jgi:hypothetical protein